MRLPSRSMRATWTGSTHSAREVPNASADPVRRRRLQHAREPRHYSATAAANAVGGFLAVPDFGTDRPAGATDFNDLARHRGIQVVRECIENASSLGQESGSAEQIDEPDQHRNAPRPDSKCLYGLSR